MINVLVEDLEVYAMLNYMRDKAYELLENSDTWDKVKKEYLNEAKADPDIVLTKEECLEILKHLK